LNTYREIKLNLSHTEDKSKSEDEKEEEEEEEEEEIEEDMFNEKYKEVKKCEISEELNKNTEITKFENYKARRSVELLKVKSKSNKEIKKFVIGKTEKNRISMNLVKNNLIKKLNLSKINEFNNDNDYLLKENIKIKIVITEIVKTGSKKALRQLVSPIMFQMNVLPVVNNNIKQNSWDCSIQE
jgi:hypothetical protein